MKKLMGAVIVLLLFARLGLDHYTGRFPEGFAVKNLENGRIIVLGHGGMGTRSWHDLNTGPSFEKARDKGADGIEMDVQLTSDGVLVAFHDDRIGVAKCPDHIAQHTYAQLKVCDRGLMKVEEVFAMDWKAGSVFSLDVKLHGADEAHQALLVQRIVALKNSHPRYRVLIESVYPEFLLLAKGNGCRDGLYLYASDADAALATCVAHGFEGISIRSEFISTQQIEACHAQGIRVMLWGVGTRWDNHQAALKSPDLIQSDKLGPLIKLVNEKR
jgi:glycerophosphoryl diester phosphodiesterase